MNGAIDVVSEPGKGSIFRFTIRLSKQAQAHTKRTRVGGDLRNMRILVVDDNATNREILLTRLRSWGMRPAEAANGVTALSVLQRALNDNDPFAIAVIDMQMPDMDGETLGRIIHSDTRLTNIRMVMLTSLGARGDARRFAGIGFSGYLTKPVRQQELKCVLAMACSSSPEDVPAPRPIVTRHTIRENLNTFAGSTARILLVILPDISSSPLRFIQT
ncbi:MAG: response regulator [Desulfobulbus sp.]